MLVSSLGCDVCAWHRAQQGSAREEFIGTTLSSRHLTPTMNSNPQVRDLSLNQHQDLFYFNHSSAQPGLLL